MHEKFCGFVVAGLVTALAFSATAQANDLRAEVHTTATFNSGDYQQTIGVAAGDDVLVVPGLFVGPEASIDKMLATNTLTTFGVSGRAGATLGSLGKLYAVAGWSSAPYHYGKGDWDAGVGFQQGLFPGTYGKIEYRHYTSAAGGVTPSRDAFTLGFGLHF